MHLRALRDIETFVQFAGFPRSGHSLIGALIDAHPHARVSHELDAMGLFQKGLPLSDIYSLINAKSREFTDHGRYWNGFRYDVPGGCHRRASPLRVIGDKKGDWAVRWVARDFDLFDRLQNTGAARKKWILVLRHPYDNIATMSLRKGRYYDELRLKYSGEHFLRALERAQYEGRIANRALDSEIDEYQRLCETVERMRQATPANDWFELSYEDLAADPQGLIRSLMAFLDLAADGRYIDGASSMVRRQVNETRHQLGWPSEQLARVDELINTTPFLRRYAAA